MRGKLEAVSGVITGSTQPNSCTVNVQLLAQGLIGEGHVGEDVWFIKTHFPLISEVVGPL